MLAFALGFMWSVDALSSDAKRTETTTVVDQSGGAGGAPERSEATVVSKFRPIEWTTTRQVTFGGLLAIFVSVLLYTLHRSSKRQDVEELSARMALVRSSGRIARTGRRITSGSLTLGAILFTAFVFSTAVIPSRSCWALWIVPLGALAGWQLALLFLPFRPDGTRGGGRWVAASAAILVIVLGAAAATRWPVLQIVAAVMLVALLMIPNMFRSTLTLRRRREEFERRQTHRRSADEAGAVALPPQRVDAGDSGLES
jgi:hypothetical protein